MKPCSFASVVAVLLAVTSAVAEDKVPRPSSSVPDFYLVTEVNKDGLVIEHLPRPTKEVYDKEEYKPAFKGLAAVNGKGKKLSAAEVARRLKPGTVILVNVDDDQPLAAAFLSLLNEDTVILSGILPLKGATRRRRWSRCVCHGLARAVSRVDSSLAPSSVNGEHRSRTCIFAHCRTGTDRAPRLADSVFG